MIKIFYIYLKFAISISVISFMVGMILNYFLKKTEFYSKKLSHLNFIKNENINKWIGLYLIKWIILNTPLKYLNQKLKFKGKMNKEAIMKIREEMTSSEIDHLIGFAFVNIFVIFNLALGKIAFAMIILWVNILMNLYPSLLQQRNKRRIDKIFEKK